MDGKVVAPQGPYPEAVMPPRGRRYRDDIDDETLIIPRVIQYRAERVEFGPLGWEVFVAEGYPMHRITDQLDAIYGLCKMIGGW
jgi:hypothetical protein